MRCEQAQQTITYKSPRRQWCLFCVKFTARLQYLRLSARYIAFIIVYFKDQVNVPL